MQRCSLQVIPAASPTGEVDVSWLRRMVLVTLSIRIILYNKYLNYPSLPDKVFHPSALSSDVISVNQLQLLDTKFTISFLKLHKTTVAFNVLCWNYLLEHLPSPLGRELHESKGCVYFIFVPTPHFNSILQIVNTQDCVNFKVGT